MIDENKLIEVLEKKAFEAEFFAGKCSSFLKVIGFGNVKRIIEHQPKVGEWIPCSKELPSESGYYFACIHNLEVDDFDFRKTWFAHVDDYDMEESEWRELYDYEKVTAWQPLPKPYKED